MQHYAYKFMIFRLGELFCGPGGLAYGATHADIGNDDFKIVHAWANDYDRSTCDTYIHNICPDAPDMKRFVKCFFELLTQIIVKVRKCKVQRVCVLHFQLAGSGGCFFLMKLYH